MDHTKCGQLSHSILGKKHLICLWCRREHTSQNLSFLAEHEPGPCHRAAVEAVDTQPPLLADLVLPGVPLIHQHHGGGHAVCRQEFLQRLVERRQHCRLLENLEPTRPQMVSQLLRLIIQLK